MSTKRLFKIVTDSITLTWSTTNGRQPDPLIVGSSPSGVLSITPLRKDVVFHEISRAGIDHSTSHDPRQQAGPYLFEETSYKVLLQAAHRSHSVDLRHLDPTLLEDLDTNETGSILHGTINFRSHVGLTRFSVTVNDQPEFAFRVEVFPSKLNYEADYRDLLAGLQERMTALALQYLRSTYHPGISFKEPRPSDLEWLILLRSIIDQLCAGLRYIAHHPRRELTRNPTARRIDKIKRVDSTVRSQVRKGHGTGRTLNLKQGFRVRERVLERRPQTTLDTPEHRWLSQQLNLIHQRLRFLRRAEERHAEAQQDRFGRATAHSKETLTCLREFENRIFALTRLKPIVDAAGPVPSNFASLKMLKASGYREAYHSCIQLYLGLKIQIGDDEQLLELSPKSLYKLYEYWCFLALLQVIEEESGYQAQVEDLFRVKSRSLHIYLAKNSAVDFAPPAQSDPQRQIAVTYNPQFTGAPILVGQEPDILMTLKDKDWPPLQLLFDVKYRIDNTSRPNASIAGPPPGAINVLHRYRDAILALRRDDVLPKRTVIQAAALYPYQEREPNEFESSQFWHALRDIGVGAIPLLPTNDSYLRQFLRHALTQGGWSFADRALAHEARERAHYWRIAATDPVLIAALNLPSAEQQRNDILNHGLYCLPIPEDSFRLRHPVGLVLYEHYTDERPSAATRYMRVSSADLLDSDEVPSHWRSSSAVYYFAYTLADSSETTWSKPLLSQSGASLPRPCWTSRLAVERARNVEELLLMHEAEWRKYEDLVTSGQRFTLRLNLHEIINPRDGYGCVWFVLFDDEGHPRRYVRYTGSTGFSEAPAHTTLPKLT